MASFRKKICIRWADIDPNFHMRHSAYYDFGAQQRIEILEELGLTLKLMQEQHIGPVLFREECIFRREIRLADNISLSSKMMQMRKDASRWTIQHEFLTTDDQVCAVLTIEGAWMNTKTRKLASPTPQIVIDVFNEFPKTDNFRFI
jgi:acyl-CoA thioester hydrolase